MMNRAFTMSLLTTVFVLGSLVGPGTGEFVAGGPPPADVDPTAVLDRATSEGTDGDTSDDTTRPTINEFFPEERPLGDCLSSLPKPDCGSEARGGWPQTVVFVAIIAGLAFIAWRIVAGSRRARRTGSPRPDRQVTPGTPDATTGRDGHGGDPTP
jgi:hypothetical protein